MLKTLLVGGAAALVCMTSHAIADGMAKRAPAASVACCETYNWTGAYIGLGVGGAFTTHDRSAKDIVNDYGTTYVTNLCGDHDGRSHAFGTVTLGYDHQFTGAGSPVSLPTTISAIGTAIPIQLTSAAFPTSACRKRTDTHGRSAAGSAS